jgi:protein gp37
MADGTKISWSEATWNPITGCSMVSPGCTNCYAMRLAGTRLRHHPSRAGLTRYTLDDLCGPVWTGEVRFNEEWLTQPLKWKKPRLIFVCAHSDLFHEAVPDEWIDRIFAVMALAPQHTFQILTKRPERMREYITKDWTYEGVYNEMGRLGDSGSAERHPYRKAFPNGMPWPLPNVWLGVTVENQAEANKRIPLLLDTPATVKWVSIEPMLGPLDLTAIKCPHGCIPPDYCNRCDPDGAAPTGTFDARAELDWIVAGGESGLNARPAHPDWFRQLRDDCAVAAIPYHHKQNGEWESVYDRDRDDPDWRQPPTAKDNSERYVNLAGGHGFHGERVVFMRRVGKRAAGRLLDGVLHDAVPEVR